MNKKYATKESKKKKGIEEACQTINKNIVIFLGFVVFISFLKMYIIVIYFIILKKFDIHDYIFFS